jgi:hypothetical protein
MKTGFSFPFLVGQLERSERRQKVSQLQVQDFFVLTKNGIFGALADKLSDNVLKIPILH